MSNRNTRRQFLKAAGAALSIPMIFPRLTLSNSPNGRLQHASIGVDGMMGGSDLQSIINSNKVDIVALCDIDSNHLEKGAQRAPNARKYRDWREMLEKEEKNIDSVNITTPDHMHAPIAYSALCKGKHVYCQKPLTHTVCEARQLRLTAKKMGVVTQMGIQIHSDIAYRMGVEIIQSGAIGKIKETHSWQGPGSWPKGGRPAGSDPVPAHVDWDLWLGVAPERPYKEGMYHPVQWRGWQDFGSGVLGDFACHILDPVFTAIQPGAPISVTAESSEDNHENWPTWQVVTYELPGSKYTAEKTFKAVWYDGGKRPPRELALMPDERNLPGAGSIIVGEEGAMVLPHWSGPQLYPLEKFKGYKRPKLGNVDHYVQWVEACLSGGKGSADFDFSGPLTEVVQLGNVASRVPNKKLLWDAPNLKITNDAKANSLLRKDYRNGWAIENLG